jgi:hypothetical protein
MARRIGIGPLGGDPDPIPDPPPPKATGGGSSGGSSSSPEVVASTDADQGRVLPICYGTTKVAALLIEKSPPKQAQPDPWLPSTAYVVDNFVSNAGSAYKCTTQGTSGTANGPTGTGAGIITDAGVKWNYVAACREWQTGVAYALNAYCTNGGALFKATTAGTSGAQAGPVVKTGTQADGFGTLVWTFQGYCPWWSAGSYWYAPGGYYDAGHPSYCVNVGNAYVVATGGGGQSNGSSSGPTSRSAGPIADGGTGLVWVWVQELPYYCFAQQFVAALAEGEATSVGQLWWDKERSGTLAKTLVLRTGPDALGQTLPTVLPAWDSSGYQHTALLCATSAITGTQAEVPAIAVELNGVQFGGGTQDVNPADIIIDLFTHARRGAALPSGRVGSSVGGSGPTDYRTYCDAAGLRLSLYLDSQRPVLDIIRDILIATNSDAVWSGGVLQVFPLSDQSITSPIYGAVNYVPVVTADYNIGPDDFVDEYFPVEVQRRKDVDCFNTWPVEYVDRAFGYVRLPQEDPDAADVDVRGRSRAPTTSLPVTFVDGTRAIQISRNLAQRSINVRNTYRFRLSWRYLLCQPGTILAVTEPGIGLVNAPMRVTEFEEDPDSDTVTITAEDYPAGVAAAQGYQPQQGDGLRSSDTGTTANLVTVANGTTSGLGTATVNAGQLGPGSVGAGALGIGQVGRSNQPVGSTVNSWPNPTSEIAPPANADTTIPVWSGDYKTLLSGSAEWYARVFAAVPWIASHTYAVGASCTNGGNGYVAIAITTGISAGSGGPTGTGSSIVDGGVTWKFVSSTVETTTTADAGYFVRRLTGAFGAAAQFSVAMPVTPGETWKFAARAFVSGTGGTHFNAWVAIDFIDANGDFFTPGTFPTNTYAATTPGGSWVDLMLYRPIPAGIVSVVATLSVFTADAGGTVKGLFDSIVLSNSPNTVTGEIPSGTVNGSNLNFTLAHQPLGYLDSGGAVVQRVTVKVSGIPQSAVAYSISGSTVTFTSGHVPQTGEIVTVDYVW